MVVLADAELHGMTCGQLEISLNAAACPVDLLVGLRTLELHFARRRAKDEISSTVDLSRGRAVGLHPNHTRIGAGSDLEVVLQLLRIAIEDEIDPRIGVGDFYFSKVWDIGLPLRRIASDEVVAFAGFRIKASKGGGSISSKETESHFSINIGIIIQSSV